MKSYAEILLTKWAYRHGLTPLHITVPDSTGATRLWWFYSGHKRQSSYFGMCDEDAITFFGSTVELTEDERQAIDDEQGR